MALTVLGNTGSLLVTPSSGFAAQGTFERFTTFSPTEEWLSFPWLRPESTINEINAAAPEKDKAS